MVRWWWVLLTATGCAFHEMAERAQYTSAQPVEPSAPSAPRTDEFGIVLEDAEPMAPEPAAAAEARKVHYDAWARLRVSDPRAALEDVSALAAEVGGRTEQMAGATVTVRVPVASFAASWERALGLGDVMDRAVRADDITEQYTAFDLRVRILKETQTRLVALLAQSRSETERLRLLEELTRVTEELDATESKLRALADLADFSRITVEAVAREAFSATGGRPSVDGFGWIRVLSPFRRAVWSDPHRVELPTPEGLVALAPRGPYAAESADGVALWTWRTTNDPVGTSAFWISAVEDRLAAEFARAETKTLGGWSCLALDQPAADAPYRWQICARADGRHLEVGQVYFPGPGQVARYGAAVDAAFGPPTGS